MTNTLDGEPRSIPISALEHYDYCPRQAALIHVEGYFEANLDTVRGDLAHAAVNQLGIGQDRQRRRIWRSLPVWSEALGLHGVCDVVEFGDGGPIPIEHKSGGYHPGGPADLQVGAQVLCLREMFHIEVARGVIFAGRDRRRHEITVDFDLVARVVRAAEHMRDLFGLSRLPEPVMDRRCRRCSLHDGCMPYAPSRSLDLYRPRPVGDWRD